MSGWLVSLRALPPAAVDAGLTVLALVAQAVPFFFDDGRSWDAVEFLPVLLVALPVFWRRRAPITCLLISSAGIAAYAVVGGDGPEQPIWYGALIVMYTMAARTPRTFRLIALVASGVGIVVIGGVFGSVTTAVREGVLWGGAYALGRGAQLRGAYATMLEERAARLERERELEAEAAAGRERARIARDMHDVLAHAVSLMVVQAEAGPVAVRTRPDRAEAAFDAIAGAGRDAMTQLRRMLGILEQDDGPRAPQPSLDGLSELVAGVGPHVSLTASGPRRDVPPDVEIAAYRIVQEALTNVVKHANADTASVALDWRQAELLITIVDDGAGTSTRSGSEAGGHGLIGIKERALACGGSAWFGPAPGGRGFQVSVRLPT